MKKPVEQYLKPDPIRYLTPETLNIVKGFLIVSIVYGHLRSFTGNNDIFTAIYGYHVAAFLILPFLYPASPLTKAKLGDWLVRYMVPFFIFFFMYLGLRSLAFGVPDFSAVVYALLTMTQQSLSDAIAGSVLWFLPALLLMRVFIGATFSLSQKFFYMALLVAFSGHVLVGLIPRDIAKFIPFSMVNIFYLFFIGIALRASINIFKSSLKPGKSFLFWAVFMGSQIALIKGLERIDIAGFYIPHLFEPARLLVGSAMLIALFLALLSSSYLAKIPYLQKLGEHSFVIFLIHQPFLFVLWKGLENISGHTEVQQYAVVISIFVALITLGLTLLISMQIWKRSSIRFILLPKSRHEFFQVFANSRHKL